MVKIENVEIIGKNRETEKSHSFSHQSDEDFGMFIVYILYSSNCTF